MMILADAEDLLDFWYVADIRIVNLFRIQFFHFFLRDKAALMAEPLFG